MTFLRPFMLWGLLGALLPIIIHLIHKRHPRRQEFGAIEFVIRSVERVRRGWRLKRFLLLTARILLIAALATAAARPLIGEDAGRLAHTSGPQRIGLVIDASLSMRARLTDGSTGFEHAIRKARSIIQGLGPEDQMAIVIAAKEPEVLLSSLSGSKAELLGALTKTKPGYAYVDIADAVATAGQLIADTESKESGEIKTEDKGQRQIIVVCDLAAHAFRQRAGLHRQVKLSVIDVFEGLDGSKRSNYGITEVEIQVVPSTKTNTVQTRARIRSFQGKQGEGSESMPRNINLRGPRGVAVETSVNLVRGNLVDKTMEYSFDAIGRVALTIELEPDLLAEDDVRYAYVNVEDRVSSLIVDGAPSGLPKEDEIFYLERALSAGAKDQPTPKIVNVDDLSQENLSLYKVLILAGVTTINSNDGRRIVDFVERGGGLFVTTTENIDVDQFNAVLGKVLPRALRGLKKKNALSNRNKHDDSALLSEISNNHPVMTIFSGDALEGLKTTRTQAYMLLQPDRNREANVLAAFDDGQPALIEAKARMGRVILLTTSIDRDLSDFAIRPAFVPLIRNLLLYLGNSLAEHDSRVTLVGETRRILLPAGTREIQIIGPKRQSLDLYSTGKSSEFIFEHTATPGHYQVFTTINGETTELETEHFSVNTDPRESDLSPLTVDEAMTALRGEVTIGDKSEETSSNFEFNALGFSNPESLARLLLMLMLCAFLVETLLTSERRTRKKPDKVVLNLRPWYTRIFGR